MDGDAAVEERGLEDVPADDVAEAESLAFEAIESPVLELDPDIQLKNVDKADRRRVGEVVSVRALVEAKALRLNTAVLAAVGSIFCGLLKCVYEDFSGRQVEPGSSLIVDVAMKEGWCEWLRGMLNKALPSLFRVQ